MAIDKTEAVVLRSINQGETSKILTLYSREFGKVSVMARGARKMKSRFGALLEPLNHLAVVFYRKEGRDLQYLSQADLLDSFPGIKAQLENTTLAMAVCELLDKVQQGEEPSALLFRLLLSTLRSLEKRRESGDDIFRAFQMHASGILGFRPHLEACLGCGQEPVGPVDFDLGSGGPVCRTCRASAGPDLHPLSAETMAALRRLQHTHISKLGKPVGPRALQNDIDAFLWAYLRYHVEGLKELKALRFLKGIR